MSESGRRTQTDKLAGAIADAILSGDLAPGLKLDEASLAERHHVSRTPVREALRQLASSGLIEIRPRRGAIVTQATPERLEQLFIAMGELEATCARLSAQRMTPIERRRLQALHESMGGLAAVEDAAGFTEANSVLHGQIYTGAHNDILADLAKGLRRRLDPFRRAQFRSEGRLARSHAEHDAIVASIIGGDAARAHAAMIHHVSLVEEAVARVGLARKV